MRTAYRGRAAAYEKKGEREKALADHNMALTYFGIEVEILNSLEAPNRDKVLQEAAQAYLARGRCLQALDRSAAAQLDRKHADDLQALAQKLASASADTKELPRRIHVINAWSASVSLV